MNTAVIITVMALALGVVALVFFLKRFVVQPMAVVVTSLDRLADGDFTTEIDLDRRDEIGRLVESARHIRDDLGRLLGNIVDTARQLDEAGDDLAGLSERNRERLNTQQNGTAQVATASEELAATARDIRIPAVTPAGAGG